MRILLDDGFEVLLTSDQNIQFQQNLTKTALFVVILSVLAALEHSPPCNLVRISK